MFRLTAAVILTLTIAPLSGCAEQDEFYKNINITDLAPSRPDSPEQASAPNKPVEIGFAIVRVSPDKLDRPGLLWDALYTAPLKAVAPRAFSANGFAAGFGDRQSWETISKIFNDAGAASTKKTSMLIFDDRPRDIPVAAVADQTTVFYRDIDNRISGVTLENGAAAWRLAASRVSEQPILYRLTIVPVFLPAKNFRRPLVHTGDSENNAIEFSASRFHLKIGPGEFLLLGPAQAHSASMTLDRLFFRPAGPEKMLHFYLIFCGGTQQ